MLVAALDLFITELIWLPGINSVKCTAAVGSTTELSSHLVSGLLPWRESYSNSERWGSNTFELM